MKKLSGVLACLISLAACRLIALFPRSTSCGNPAQRPLGDAGV